MKRIVYIAVFILLTAVTYADGEIFKRWNSFEVEAKGVKKAEFSCKAMNWEKIEMKRTGKNSFGINLELPEGVWEYKYYFDGVENFDSKGDIIEEKDGIKKSYVKIYGKDLYGEKRDVVLQGKVEKIEIESKILGEKTKVNIYFPPDYNKKKRYPVLYLLHGYDMNEEQWIDAGIANYMDNLIADKKIEPFIVVMPNGGTSFYTGKTEEYITSELREYINKKYSVYKDREKTAVCGMSMGGYGAFRVAFNHQNLYGISVPLSAAFFDYHIKEIEESLNSGKQINFQMKIYCGLQDNIDLNGKTIIENNREAVKIFQKYGVKFDYEFDKGTHDYWYWGIKAERYLQEISDFFIKKN